MWSISDPCLDRPIQICPYIVSHLPFHGSIASLLGRSSCTIWFDTSPACDLVQQFLRSLCEKIFVLDRPHICNPIVVLDAQKVSDFVGSHFHDIIVRFSASIISHFVKGLVSTVIKLLVFASWQGLYVAGNDVFVFKMLLTSPCFIEFVRPNTFHGPGRSEEFHPPVVWTILQMVGSMMGNVLHSLEPIVRVSELRNDESLVRVSIRRGVLKPMLVTCEFRSDFNGV